MIHAISFTHQWHNRSARRALRIAMLAWVAALVSFLASSISAQVSSADLSIEKTVNTANPVPGQNASFPRRPQE